MESANAIINTAIDALRGEAEAIQAKIAALESSLLLAGDSEVPANAKARKGRPKKIQANVEAAPQKKARGRPKKKVEAVEDTTEPKDKIKAAAEKRSKSWDDSKKKAAAERMRKYWAERKKETTAQP